MLDIYRALHDARGMPVNEPKLIGSKDVCDILDINRSTLVRWISEDRIKAIGRLSTGAWIFDAEYIADFSATRRELSKGVA